MTRVSDGAGGYLAEEDVLEIINKIAGAVSKNFILGYFDRDDILQQCRLFALEALPRYCPERTRKGLGSFLFTHLHNRLCNLIRDKVRRNDSPCKDCASGNFCERAAAEQGGSAISPCCKFSKWKRKQDTKASLMNMGELTDASSTSELVGKKLENTEILLIIEENLSGELLETYHKFRSGAKLSRKKIEKLFKVVREIALEEGIAYG